MDEAIKIERKLSEINTLLTESCSANSNYGFLSGLSGKVFFLYHYEKLYNKKRDNVLCEAVDNIITSVLQYKGTPSFCSGIGGVCYLLAYLTKECRLNIPQEEEIQDYLNKALWQMRNEKNYEFLYGAMGMDKYMVMNPKIYFESLIAILSFLDATKEQTKTGYR